MTLIRSVLGGVLSLLCISLSSGAFATDAEAPLIIPKLKHTPVLAEYLRGAPEEHGVEIKNFRQLRPGNGTPSSQEMKAYLSYDDTHFYAVFVVTTDPKNVRAHIARRENIIGDDELVLELDTFHDKQRSFVFHANPYGVQFDGKRTDGLEIDIDFNFDTQWRSEGQLTDTGFVTLMAIPFKSLRFASADVQTWGIAVGHIIGGVNEWSFWPTINQNGPFVGQMASATIPEKLVSGRNLQLNPSVHTGSSHILNYSDVNSPVWQEEKRTRAGLDAKWVLGESMALDLTLNPDFSEVESDEPQALVNKRYEVLFPEKRPFFLENAGFFQTPQPLFFSRRIAEPKTGLRLTGREQAWSFGTLLIDDVAPGADVEPQYTDFGKRTGIAVARVQNDFSKGSNAGVLLTDYRFGASRNTVMSADLHYQFDDSWNFNGQLASSRSEETNTPTQHGQLGFAEVKRTARNFSYLGQYLDVANDFQSKLAFLPRRDVRQHTQMLRYMWDVKESSWVQMAGPELKMILTQDHANVVQDKSLELGFSVSTLFSSDMFIETVHGSERYDQQEFRKKSLAAGFFSDQLKWLNFGLMGGVEESINYTPASGQRAGLGKGKNMILHLGLKPHSQLRLDGIFLLSELNSQTANDGIAPGTRIYRDLLFRSKLAYQHNRYLGARLIFDYHHLDVNPLLSGLKSGKRLNRDFQLSYVLEPGTTVYAGYADVQENLAWVGSPRVLRDTENLNLKTGRTIFVKMNYLFRL